MQKKKKKKGKSEQNLRLRYYDPRRIGSYSGLCALKKAAKNTTTTADVKKWLSYQDTYTLHKPVRLRFPRRPVIVNGIDDQHQADLVDLSRLKRDNDDYRYLLTCIDVFSKYAWVVPLKVKTGTALVSAFDSIYYTDRKPNRLQTDKGGEFINRTVQAYLKTENIDFFTTDNQETKASVVERFNRTLKEKLWRYFTRQNSFRYLEVLPHLVRVYNNTHHRSIRRSPASVNIGNEEDVWYTLYDNNTSTTASVKSTIKKSQAKRRQLRVGDRVRISKVSRTFAKKYEAGWSEELYRICAIKRTLPVTYIIQDDAGEEIRGSFYKEELQKVGEKQLFRIEKILNERKGQVLVKWWGYPTKFNSWLPKQEVCKYRD